MKNTIKMILGFACALVLFVSCSPGAVNYDIKLGDLRYGNGNDKVHVQVTSDNSNVMVRGAKCYWTFDGSEPTKDSRYNNFDDPSYEFDMEIPFDFYDGKIKFLCEITYAAMGKKKTETKKITKNFTTKYHSLGSGASRDLYKGKGFQKEYSIETIPVSNSKTFTVKENGTLKITFLQGSGFFKVDAESIPVNTPSYSKQVSAGDTITVSYHSDIVATTSSASGTKSAEYLLILE